jgi:hypothetical protein
MRTNFTKDMSTNIENAFYFMLQSYSIEDLIALYDLHTKPTTFQFMYASKYKCTILD